MIHFGRIASADAVMRSGEDRDMIAKQDGVIAFEMESAGIWDSFVWSLKVSVTTQTVTRTKRGRHMRLWLIDALDECGEKEVQNMVSFLEPLSIDAAQADLELRICLSSRHYPTVSMRKSLELVVEQMQEHDEGIKLYIVDKLLERSQEMESRILNKACGIFMWVVLVVAMLNLEFNNGKLEAMQKLLDELPPDIEQVFQTLLNKDIDNKDETIFAIQWLLFCRRPIQLVELFCAMQVGTTPKQIVPWDTLATTRDNVSKRISHSSEGLIEQRNGEATLQFIHQSHAEAAQACGVSQREFLQRFLTHPKTDRIVTACHRLYTNVRCRNVLQILSLNGYVELVRVFSHCTEFNVNVQDDGYYGNALQAAVLGEHPEMVNLLLGLGANVNAKAGKYGYALQAAAWTRNKEIVRIMLRHEANVFAQGGRYGTPHRAAEKSRLKSITKILDASQNIKVKNNASSASCAIL